MARRSIPEEAAVGLLRKHCVTDPPVLVDEIVAAEGIKIGRSKAKGTEIGFALRKDDERFIGVDLHRGEPHQRWIVAHCLGHLLLHDKPLIVDYQVSINLRDEVSTLGTAFEEAQANYFAVEFLMPRVMVARILPEVASITTGRDEVVASLARSFEVGREAMIYRLISLGVISP